MNTFDLDMDGTMEYCEDGQWVRASDVEKVLDTIMKMGHYDKHYTSLDCLQDILEYVAKEWYTI